MEEPVVPLERNLYGHPLAGLLWERQFEFYWNTVGKNLNWECLFVNRARGLFLSVYVDEIKLAGKIENIVDLVEPTSCLDHVFFGLYSKRMSDQQRYCG